MPLFGLLVALLLGLSPFPAFAQSAPARVQLNPAVLEFRFDQIDADLKELRDRLENERNRTEQNFTKQTQRIDRLRADWQKEDQRWREQVSWQMDIYALLIGFLVAILGLVGAGTYLKASHFEKESQEAIAKAEKSRLEAEKQVHDVHQLIQQAEDTTNQLKKALEDARSELTGTQETHRQLVAKQKRIDEVLAKDPNAKLSKEDEDQWEETIEQLKGLGVGQRTADDLIKLGLEAEREGELDQALEFYSEAIGKDPKHPSAYFRRAYLYQARFMEPQKSVSDYARSLKLNPDDQPTCLNLSEVLICIEKVEAARAQLDRLGEPVEPFLPIPLLHRGLIELLQGNPVPNVDKELDQALEQMRAQQVKLTWSFKELRHWLPQSSLSQADRERAEGWIAKLERYQEEFDDSDA